MKVNIWSDTRCPFCYIGKHKFEKALANFPHKDQVKVVWHSFQLDASLKTNLEMDHATYLHQAKGYPLEQIEQITRKYLKNVVYDDTAKTRGSGGENYRCNTSKSR